eukprot:m.240549 g.240549  ORF g.240549 m.240549 type:complete len:55 (+) comp33764_c9_seq29:1504-1668(+)
MLHHTVIHDIVCGCSGDSDIADVEDYFTPLSVEVSREKFGAATLTSFCVNVPAP